MITIDNDWTTSVACFRDLEVAFGSFAEAAQVVVGAIAEMAAAIQRAVRLTVEALARWATANYRFYQRVRLYSQLRRWRIPHVVAIMVAYLWIMKRWPPKTALSWQSEVA